MKSRLIFSRFDGKCAKCGKAHGRGVKVWYLRGVRGVRCEACGPHSEAELAAAKEAKAKSGPVVPVGAAPRDGAAMLCADGIYRAEVSSIGEAVRHAFSDESVEPRNAKDAQDCIRDNWGTTFLNGHTRESFDDALVTPPRRVMEAMNAMRAELVESVRVPQSSRRKVRRGQEWGDELDADRVLAFDPNCWDRNTRVPANKRTVSIGVNFGVNCYQETDELLWRGAAAAALADVLVSEFGVNVEIVATHCVERPTDKVGIEITRYVVKDAQMPLDLGAVAFALSDVAFYRVVGIYGGVKQLPGIHSAGWGRSGMMNESDRAGYDFFIDHDARSRETAVAWLKAAAKSETEAESEVATAAESN